MFFEGDRITDVRKFILADTDADRTKAIKKLLPHQRKDSCWIHHFTNSCLTPKQI